MITSWQQLRSELNHDWLKNRYLRQLQAFIIRIQQKPPDRDRIVEFLDHDFPAWRVERGKIVELLQEAEQALSPARLIEQPPLSHCSDADRAWLAWLVHELWLVRKPVRRWCDAGREAFADADRRFEEANAALGTGQGVDVERLLPSVVALQVFSAALQRLVRQLSEFPHEIQVV
jgi:hypothetical protein